MSTAASAAQLGPPPPVAADAIAVEGLRKRCAGSGEEAVKGIDFRAAQGEFLGLLDPNGAGRR